MTPIVRAEALRHVYSAGTPFEKVAIDGIDLSLTAGQLVGVIGHTGSGKSTFIQHLNGLLKPTSGAVYFEEQDIHRSREATRDVRFSVGLVFQYPEYQLFEETVYKDIAFGPKNMKLSDEEVDARVKEAAHFVGLPDELMELSPLELSGGQKRRIAIAGVIAMGPEVLILDEPTAGLDPIARDQVLGILARLARERDACVLFSSHITQDVEKIASRALFLVNGALRLDAGVKALDARFVRLRLPDSRPDWAARRGVVLGHGSVILERSAVPPEELGRRESAPVRIEDVLVFMEGGVGDAPAD